MRNLGLMDPAFLGGLTSYDPDAAAYITAVEVADGQALETGVKDAINAFVLGCKADGIWNAIKASCILAGARTLAGALVPLVGAAPTNFNFVAGDYNRKTGLVGDGTSKYLNANRNNNLDQSSSAHLSVHSTEAPTGGQFPLFIGSSGGSGERNIYKRNTGGYEGQSYTGGVFNFSAGNYAGFLGSTRNTTTLSLRSNAATTSFSSLPNQASSLGIGVFAAPGNNLSVTYSNARIAFYSIGEALDLALLDARVSALVNALAVAIP